MSLRFWIFYVAWFCVSVSVVGASIFSIVSHVSRGSSYLSVPASLVGIVGGVGLLWECIVGLKMDRGSALVR